VDTFIRANKKSNATDQPYSSSVSLFSKRSSRCMTKLARNTEIQTTTTNQASATPALPTLALTTDTALALRIVAVVADAVCCQSADNKVKKAPSNVLATQHKAFSSFGYGFKSTSSPVLESFSLCQPGKVPNTTNEKIARPMLPRLSSISEQSCRHTYGLCKKGLGWILTASQET
jgi:hypothetical protein